MRRISLLSLFLVPVCFCLVVGFLVAPQNVRAQSSASAVVPETPYNQAARQVRAYAHYLHDQEQQLERREIELQEKAQRNKRFLRFHYIILALLELLVVILLFRAYHMHVEKIDGHYRIH